METERSDRPDISPALAVEEVQRLLADVCGSGRRLLVFAGTSEGRKLATFLAERGLSRLADFSVATAYGKELLDAVPGIAVLNGRLDAAKMAALMQSGNYGLIVDTTHPFAVDVSANIAKSAAAAGLPRIRIVRSAAEDRREIGEERQKTAADRIVTVAGFTEAAAVLDKSDEPFLLATGSKALADFAHIRNFAERATVRVLPYIRSIEACLAAGVKSGRIIGMQGPFTEEMNLATMRMYGLETVVTKSTGKSGGFEEKLKLAEAGYRVIVITRPTQENGIGLNAFLEAFRRILFTDEQKERNGRSK